MPSSLDRILDESLHIEIVAGGITSLGPHTTGWRMLPSFVFAQLFPGRGTLLLKNGGVHPIRNEEAVALAAGVTHRIDQTLERCVSRWAHLNFCVLDGFDIFQLYEVPPIIPGEIARAAGEAIQIWREEQSTWLAQGVVYAKARQLEIGCRILASLGQCCRLQDDADRQLAGVRALRPVIQYLHTHYAQPLTRDRLARIAGLSPATFHRLFRKYTHHAPVEYLRRVRIRQAQQLILSTDHSVKEIAVQVGYDDPFVFSRLFKRLCGVSPSEYQQTIHGLGGIEREG